MFKKFNSNGFVSPIDGIEMKTLVHGEKTLMTRFHLKKGSVLPKHTHPHEQTGVLISGKIQLFVEDQSFTVETGDAWVIQSNKEHWAQITEDSIAIEVFSPVREDYLPQ